MFSRRLLGFFCFDYRPRTCAHATKRAAAALVNRWKEAAATSQQLRVQEGGSGNDVMAVKPSGAKAGGGWTTTSKAKVKGTAVTPGGSSGGCGGAGSGSGGAERNPAQEKQRYVEEGFRCRTWHELYQVRHAAKKRSVMCTAPTVAPFGFGNIPWNLSCYEHELCLFGRHDCRILSVLFSFRILVRSACSAL